MKIIQPRHKAKNSKAQYKTLNLLQNVLFLDTIAKKFLQVLFIVLYLFITKSYIV